MCWSTKSMMTVTFSGKSSAEAVSCLHLWPDCVSVAHLLACYTLNTHSSLSRWWMSCSVYKAVVVPLFPLLVWYLGRSSNLVAVRCCTLAVAVTLYMYTSNIRSGKAVVGSPVDSPVDTLALSALGCYYHTWSSQCMGYTTVPDGTFSGYAFSRAWEPWQTPESGSQQQIQSTSTCCSVCNSNIRLHRRRTVSCSVL